MSENDFDFSLPKAGEKSASSGKWKLICVLQLLTLVCTALVFLSLRGGSAPAGGVHADADKLLELAQRLEKQGLAREAAQAWKEYMLALKPDAEKEAKLWYRIGVIQQEGRLYEEALASFYRSDMAMKLPVLETEITRRTQECLAALGKAVAMKRNLEERTSMGASAQAAAPLVSIGDWKLTHDEVEALAEREIEMMLASSNLPEEQKLEQKKQMLKQLNQGDGLRQFTMHLVTQEMLYRAAMDEKLMEEPAIRDEVMRLERNVLAEAYMRRRLANLNASESEIQDFYKANPDLFKKPEDKENGKPAEKKNEKEVFEEARQKLMERKTQEAQNRVMQELAQRYQVVWNMPAPKGSPAPAAEPPAPTPQNAAPAGGDK